METIEEAKAYIKSNFDKGVGCPCCNQMVKKYKYNLFATSAVALIDLYTLTKTSGQYFHISQFAEARGDKPRASHFAELRFWKLIEPMDSKTKTTNSSGMWSITPLGRLFVEEKFRVNKSVFVFNNTFLGFDGKLITISEALGNKFNYEQLML